MYGCGRSYADVGFVYNVGIGAIVIIGTFHLGWIALIFMSKRLRASGASTLPDFLGMRFSTSTKAIAGIVTLTMMLNTTAAQMAAAGTIMDVLGLTTRDMGIIVGGIFILVLTITGGLYSVAVTDTIQAVLLTIGCGIIVPITAYAAAGGPAEVFSTVRAVNPELLTLKGAITPIGFIGLIVPHIARLMLNTTDHYRLLPATMLLGAATAMLCMLLSVLPLGNGLIPINAITPVIGVPVIIYLILNRRKIFYFN